MPLIDPELELLLETLSDDPGDPVYVQVGEELTRRARWTDAGRVLQAGLAKAPRPRGLELLARVWLELGRPDDALSSLSQLPPESAKDPELARIRILALERAGRKEAAKLAAASVLERSPDDPVAAAAMARLAAPRPAPSMRGANPFYTAARAEAYVGIGRADRALRVYRRLLLAHPGHLSIVARIEELASARHIPARAFDDLSAELGDPALPFGTVTRHADPPPKRLSSDVVPFHGDGGGFEEDEVTVVDHDPHEPGRKTSGTR